MKTSIKQLAAVIITAIFTTGAIAQATENTAAGAKIIIPITITETSALHFGTMAVLSGTAGTCVLSTTGGRTQTAGVNLSAQAPTASNAAYNVTGALNTTYAIVLPATIVVVNGGDNMTINNLLARTASAGANGLTGDLGAGGTDSFTIGGTLNVSAGQAAGVYTVNFDVTVAYN